MNLPLVTGKTVLCTSCGARVPISRSATYNERGERIYEFKCKKCGALFEYNGEFVDRILQGKEKI